MGILSFRIAKFLLCGVIAVPAATTSGSIKNSELHSSAWADLDSQEQSNTHSTVAIARSSGSSDIRSINHILFMVQKGRSFDQYYGKLNSYRLDKGLPADVDGLPTDASNPSADNVQPVAAFHMTDTCTGNPSPSWQASHLAYNRDEPTSAVPKMDG